MKEVEYLGLFIGIGTDPISALKLISHTLARSKAIIIYGINGLNG
jgi:hypothetical protein